MTLRKTETIDLLSVQKVTGDVVLTLLDEEDWADEHEHLFLLQEKLNSYLRFIESGELLEQLAAMNETPAPGTPVKVKIIGRFPISAHARSFLARASTIFDEAGFSLSHEVRPDTGD